MISTIRGMMNKSRSETPSHGLKKSQKAGERKR
jgi:hypothetical protein